MKILWAAETLGSATGPTDAQAQFGDRLAFQLALDGPKTGPDALAKDAPGP